MEKKPNFVSVVLLGLALINILTQKCFGDFILKDNQQLEVIGYHGQGHIYDTSRAILIFGAAVGNLYAHNSSSVDVSGGGVGLLYVMDNTSATISSGIVSVDLIAWFSGSVNISGGEVHKLDAQDTSSSNISGGSVETLRALESSSVTFRGKNFGISGGLALDGDRVLGTGTLTGQWMDGSQWTTIISNNDPTATVRVVPEPMTLLLLGLGGLVLRKSRR